MTQPEKEPFGVLRLDLSHTLKGRKFSSYKDIRLASSDSIREYREQFVKVALSSVGVLYDPSLPRRELVEAMEQNHVAIVKDESDNTDKVFKEGVLIASWNKDFELQFSETGNLYCNIRYTLPGQSQLDTP